MQLEALQSFVTASVQGAAPLDADDELAAACAQVATGNDRLTGAAQLDIYRRQFWLRHRDCLQEDYPATAYLLGQEGFDAFARAYLVAHPPASYTLRDLGHAIVELADRYDDFPPELAGYLRDLIRFEHAFIDAFDCADTPAVTVDALGSLAPEAWATACLTFHPSLTLLALEHPVHRLRQAVRDGEQPARQLADDGPVQRRVTTVALYRDESDLKIHYLALEPRPFALLRALSCGAPLAAACEALADTLSAQEQETLPTELSQWFAAWAARGWVTGVVTSHGTPTSPAAV